MSKKIYSSFAGYQKGDWVSFMSDNQIVIGQVEYITEEFGHIYLATTVGNVSIRSVLELKTRSEPLPEVV